MKEIQQLTPTIIQGWHTYQGLIIKALKPLDESQLALRASENLRSVDEIARHMIGARARWFYGMDESGETYKDLRSWDRRGEPPRSAAELVNGLEHTWEAMQEAVNGWSAEQWEQTWPGEDDSEPEVITRQWVLWHLIEHDLYHGGEISLTLGMHGISAVDL